MTRQEILKVARPILFNTDMVQAILDGRKATTRRPCKIKINGGKLVTHGLCDIAEYPETNIDGLCANFYDNGHFYKGCAKPPYKVGDYLYVREAWQEVFETEYALNSPEHYVNIRKRILNFDIIPKVEAGISSDESCATMQSRVKYYVFRASNIEYADNQTKLIWRPSIHMPKEAARTFLRIADVRVERLQEITYEQALKEGLASRADFISTFFKIYPSCTEESWVWVIEFERAVWDSEQKSAL